MLARLSQIFLTLLFCLFAESCSTHLNEPNEAFHKVTRGAVVLYLTSEERDRFSSVQSYFTSHDMMVTRLRATNDTSGRYWAEYPSINSGSSPLFTHHIEIDVSESFPLGVKEIISSNQKAVLVSGSGFIGWRLIGTVPIEKDREEPFDWFSDYPHLKRVKER